jgi:predicted nuclease with TOPRIM domain
MKKFLIKLIAPDYLDLKEENKNLKEKLGELQKDIITLVKDEDRLKVSEVQFKWDMHIRFEEAIMMGISTDEPTGLIDLIN